MVLRCRTKADRRRGLLAATAGTAEEGIPIPPPEVGSPAGEQATAVAVLAGGCFWGVQGVFQHLDGVRSAISGYAGGEAATAQYRMVGSGRTGHAEAVEVTFDPTKISYGGHVSRRAGPCWRGRHWRVKKRG
jgi:peptide-methionine (S)-S-oxide reductase